MENLPKDAIKLWIMDHWHPSNRQDVSFLLQIATFFLPAKATRSGDLARFKFGGHRLRTAGHHSHDE